MSSPSKMTRAIEMFDGDKIPAAILVDRLPPEPTLKELLEIRSLALPGSRARVNSLKALKKAKGDFETWNRIRLDAMNRDTELHNIAAEKTRMAAANIFDLETAGSHATRGQLDLIMARMATIKAPFSEWETLQEDSLDPFKTLSMFRMAATAGNANELLCAYKAAPTHHTADLRSLKWILLQAMIIDKTIDIRKWWEIFLDNGDDNLKQTAWKQTQLLFEQNRKAA